MSHLVIVSGGSSGIGRALMATCPYDQPYIIDVSRSGSGIAEHVEADLSTEAGWDIVRELFDARVRTFDGERVVFVHSAGSLTPIGFAGEVPSEDYRRGVMLNSAAPQVLGDAFLAAARELDARADYVVIGSGAATTVYPGWSGYGAAKAGAAQWVRAVGQELDQRGSNNRVWWIAPGLVATPMQAEIRSMSERDFPTVDRFHELFDTGLLREPEDVARQLWSVLDDDHGNGAILDLRQLAAG